MLSRDCKWIFPAFALLKRIISSMAACPGVFRFLKAWGNRLCSSLSSASDHLCLGAIFLFFTDRKVKLGISHLDMRSGCWQHSNFNQNCVGLATFDSNQLVNLIASAVKWMLTTYYHTLWLLFSLFFLLFLVRQVRKKIFANLVWVSSRFSFNFGSNRFNCPVRAWWLWSSIWSSIFRLSGCNNVWKLI